MVFELLPSVVVSGSVSFLVALGTVEYRLQRKQTVEAQQQVQTWYADAAKLAHNVRILWKNEYEEKTGEGGKIQYDDIQRQMKLRSRQISNHISDSTSKDVDLDVANELEELSRLCLSLSDITTSVGIMDEFREEGEKIVEQAENVEELALTKISK